ncbi:MAG TPA: gliding motility-associated C-terminal domain-containing protein [Saprospiraceae bacterium]|nr:gliding motility-associated C-terminal domain-containing protein [Saprospiraceae bacterium]
MFRKLSILGYFIPFLAYSVSVSAQCTPPATDDCQSANVLCGLDEVNGYTCQNTSDIHSDIYPCGAGILCPSAGGAYVPHNTSWWAFVTQGGNVSVTVTFNNCGGAGVQLGIWGDCNCGEEVACNPFCNGSGSFTLTANLVPCKTYYLFIDGCSGDVCNFTLSTTGGASPTLAPLGNIIGKKTVCEGFCNEKWSVPPQPGGCEPEYVWTVDGVEVGGTDLEVELDDEWGPGMHTICVTAVIGNPGSGSTCDEEGPKCFTFEILPKPQYRGPDKYICIEDVPYDWHGISISQDGEYEYEFVGPNCCKYDSIRQFFILPQPEKPSVYYIGCSSSDLYIDPTTGRSYGGCNNPIQVDLYRSTQPFKCDSAYDLYTIFPNFSPGFQLECNGSDIVIKPGISDITDYCGNNADVTYQYDYAWFRKSNSTQIISRDEDLIVDKKDDYCVEFTFTVNYGTASKKCKRIFCENINEDLNKPYAVPLKGDTLLCLGRNGLYWIDTIINQSVLIYNWTVTGGIILTKDPFDTSAIEVQWTGPVGKGQVCVSYQTLCGTSPETCMDVTILPAPKPNAGPNDSICSLSNVFNGKEDVGGKWTQICGPGTGTFNEYDIKSPISVDRYGKYCFVWTETRQGCTTTDTVEMYFNGDPKKDKETIICAGDNMGYTYNFQVSGGMAPYRVIKGNGSIDANNNYNSLYVKNLINDTVVIRDFFGCEFTFIINHECKCTNAIGLINSIPEDLCEDGVLNLRPDIYDSNGEILDPLDTLMFFIYTNPTNPLGSILRYITTNTIVKDATLNFNTTYYIGAILGRKDNKGGIDFKGGCLRERYGKPFTFYEYPKPNAGLDDAICGLVYDLAGKRTSSIPNGQIRWKVLNNKGVIFSATDVESPNIVAQSGYGTYTFELEETNNICVRTDIVEITFNAPPEIDNVEKICVDKNIDFTYRVEADIKSGKPPYTLLTPGGQILGNKFLSDTLVSLDTFKILVRDANGCISELVADIHNCNCGIISAGQLDTALTRVCEDQCVTLREILPDTINPVEDIRMYVLSSSQTDWKKKNSSTVIYQTFTDPNQKICFDPTRMITEQIYYLIKIVGNDLDNDMIIDSDDDCFRITSQAFVWSAYPKADPGKPDSVCGLSYDMNANLTLGNGTWSLIQGPGNINFSDVNDANCKISVTQKGTYKLKWSVLNYSCERENTVDITFWDSPNFKGNPIIECDNTAENFRFKIDVENGEQTTWNVQAFYNSVNPVVMTKIGPATYQSGWIPTGSTVDYSVNDRHDCAIDKKSFTHQCVCITDIGPLDLTPIILCVDGTAQAKYDDSKTTKDGNDVVRYVLYDGNPTDPLTGKIIRVNDNGQFSFDPQKMTLGKTYYIAVIVGNLDPVTGNVNYSDRCLKFTPGVPVTWYPYPIANITGLKTLTCTTDKIVLDGTQSKDGSNGGLDYTWSTADGQFVDPTQTNSGTVQINKPGTYKLYVKDKLSGCTNEINYIIGQDIKKPTVAIAEPRVLTCDVLSVDLDGSKSSQGPQYSALWQGNVSNPTSYISSTSQVGSYILVITNSDNGCKDSARTIVVADRTPPVSQISQLGQLTCSVNQVKLDGSASKGANNSILTSFKWTALQGNIISGQGTKEVLVGKPGGKFILEVKDSRNGCIDIDTIDVVENGNPLGLIQSDPQDPRCFGDRNGSIQILDVLDKNNNRLSNLTFSVNGGPFVSARDFPNLGQGTYKITVKDKDGCVKDTTLSLKEPEKLAIKVISTTIVDQGTLVNLDSLVTEIKGGTKPYAQNEWFNKSLDSMWSNHRIYTADSTYDFIVNTIDDRGCEIQDQLRVLVRIVKDVWWPNVFSPNGDNINDYFTLWGKKVKIIRKLSIFDRWGERLYVAENIADANKGGLNKGWDGKFRGEMMMPGVYVFVAEVVFEGSNQTDIYKGDFTLLR